MVTTVITPATPYTNDLLSVTLASTDADGDAVAYTYSWTVNGAVVSAASTLPGTSFIKHDVVAVTVTPNDGTANGTAKTSASVTVLNTAPTVPSLAMSPVAPRDADNIACLVTAASSDADGDAITYGISWTLNGTAWAGPTSTTVRPGDTILAANTVDGQIWKCSFVATDGETPAAAATATAAVIDAWTFIDTTADDVATTALRDYFNSLTVLTTDFIYLEVRGGTRQGAWCSERADWYKTNYLSYGLAGRRLDRVGQLEQVQHEPGQRLERRRHRLVLGDLRDLVRRHVVLVVLELGPAYGADHRLHLPRGPRRPEPGRVVLERADWYKTNYLSYGLAGGARGRQTGTRE